MPALLRTILLSGLLSGAQSPLHCQESPEGRRHGFDFQGPILLDVDGDGKDDTFIPRNFIKKVSYPWKPDKKLRVVEEHFISFDLQLSTGQKLKSVFTYKYGIEMAGKQGTTGADYWVFALIPPDHPVKGEIDVFFYAGDDSSDDMYRLRLKNGKFKIISHKHTEGEENS